MLLLTGITRWRLSLRGGIWLLGLVVMPTLVSGYVFLHRDPEQPQVGTEGTVLWSPDAWARGETLIWHVAGKDPDWQRTLFRSAEAAVPVLARALATWSDIPTADIAWEVEGVGDFREDEGRQQNVNLLVADDQGVRGGWAARWDKQDTSGRWRRHGCTVGLGSYAFEADVPESDLRGILMHELGHCLGLAHSQTFPGSEVHIGEGTSVFVTVDPLWTGGPVMVTGSPSLALDDRIGASLLRPNPVWANTTGGIAGRLHWDGESVVYAYVWAFPNAENVSREPIGTLSGRDGRFLIEGLAPGDYILWVSEPTAYVDLDAVHLVRSEELPFGLVETVRLHPVRVVAGGVTEGVDISLRRGRQCVAPFPCMPSR